MLLIDNLNSGGSQNQITLLACGLKKRNFDVTVFYYFEQNFFKFRLDNNSVRTICIPKKGKIGLNVIYELIKLNYVENYHCIISYLSTPNVYSIALKLVGLKKSKHIISYRSMTDFNQMSIFDIWQKKIVNYFADIIVYNSYHEKENWVRKFPSLSSKSLTIYNSVENSFEKDIIAINRKVLVIGSVSKYKNGICIIEAIGKFNSRNEHKLELIWVGRKDKNIKGWGDYQMKMEELIERNQYVKKYWFWQEPVDDLTKYFEMADVLVLASKIEGLPNVVCESMKVGLPIILSNVCDHPRLVDDGKCGFLFDPESSEELYLKLSEFYNLPIEKVKDMSKCCKEYAEENFSLDVFLNQYESIIYNNELCVG